LFRGYAVVMVQFPVPVIFQVDPAILLAIVVAALSQGGILSNKGGQITTLAETLGMMRSFWMAPRYCGHGLMSMQSLAFAPTVG
jgi:hypothetical protein